MNEPSMARYFAYLDALRDSGATNMFGAGVYLMKDFGVDRKEASRVVGLWMKTFDPDKSPEERAQ